MCLDANWVYTHVGYSLFKKSCGDTLGMLSRSRRNAAPLETLPVPVSTILIGGRFTFVNSFWVSAKLRHWYMGLS